MRLFLILLISGQVASCGQKGPLRLPENAAASAPARAALPLQTADRDCLTAAASPCLPGSA